MKYSNAGAAAGAQTHTLSELFAFSTSWNWRHSRDGRVLMEEIRDLGFRKVELNYKISEQTLAGILPMVERGDIEISSVHNVFPEVPDPAYDTDSLLLGYEDEEKRRIAIELTLRTVDRAAALGAGVVVIHPGVVPVPKDRFYDGMLKELYEEGKQDTREYRLLFEEMMEYRAGLSGKYVSLIRDSLAEIGEYILKRNYPVVLGIENRPMCHQIPDFGEMHLLLEALDGLPVYFWYDCGHGMILDRLGMFDALKELEQIRGKIIGMHIHDAVGVDDHWAPYIKSSNLDDYIGLIKSVKYRVLELGVKNTPEEIIRGAGRLLRKVTGAMQAGGRNNEPAGT